MKAYKFDPGKDYPPHAWCFGPMQFFASSTRGNIQLHKNDWIVEYEGEILVLSDKAYRKFKGREKTKSTAVAA